MDYFCKAELVAKLRLGISNHQPMVSFNIGNHYFKLNGPAIIRDGGTKEWLVNGILHNSNGPAAIYSDGSSEWWVNNELIKSVEYG